MCDFYNSMGGSPHHMLFEINPRRWFSDHFTRKSQNLIAGKAAPHRSL
jgi:hypothetical protein